VLFLLQAHTIWVPISNTLARVKTTIDIADDLIRRAKLVQKRDGVTLRALVEDGLRLVLDREARRPKFRFQPVTAGTPYRGGQDVPDVNALVAEANERGAGEAVAYRVAEPRVPHGTGKKSPARKKRAKRSG
jgi:hypothetical protein